MYSLAVLVRFLIKPSHINGLQSEGADAFALSVAFAQGDLVVIGYIKIGSGPNSWELVRISKCCASLCVVIHCFENGMSGSMYTFIIPFVSCALSHGTGLGSPPGSSI